MQCYWVQKLVHEGKWQCQITQVISTIIPKVSYYLSISYLFRFPLTNEETLPLWVAATGRAKHWKPCKSSRLCGNHFQKSEYIVGHGKGLLKTTAIPTIEYRMVIPV